MKRARFNRAARLEFLVLVKGFPSSIVYRPEPKGIVVLAVAHHARRPGYWSDP